MGLHYKDSIVQLDEETSKMVQEIFEIYSSGIPVSKPKDHI